MHIAASLIPAIGLLIPLLGGVFLFRLGRRYQETYKLSRTPLAPIDKIAPGFVHVRGTVACQEPLTSPLTQVPCCYYRTTIQALQKYTQGVSTRTRYTTIYSEPASKAFYLDDGTGKTLVNPEGADYDVPVIFTTYLSTNAQGLTGTVLDPSVSHVGIPSEERVRDYVTKHAHSAGDQVRIFGNSELQQKVASAMTAAKTTYRITEYCVVDKQACSVLGTSDVNRTSANGVSTLVHKGAAQSTFLITNRGDQQESSRLGTRALGAMGVGAFLVGMSGLALLFLLATML